MVLLNLGRILTLVEIMILVRCWLEFSMLLIKSTTHDKRIREFTIDSQGMHIGKSFRNVTGILSGNPIYVEQHQVNSGNEIFEDEVK